MTKKNTFHVRAALAAGFVAVAMAAGSALAEEVNLKTLAVKDGSGNLIAYSDGNAIWASGREADKHFDGSVNGNDFYDPKQIKADTWTGYQVSTPCRLTRVRYYGRTDLGASVLASHMGVSAVEGANSSDFSDAVVIMTFNPPADYNGGFWVEQPVTATAQAFQYFRIIEHYGTYNSAAGAVKEIEFYGVDADSFDEYAADNMKPPTDLVAAQGDYPRTVNTLSWNIAPCSSETSILRATGANGPWTEIARVCVSNVYHDVTAPAGVRSYYRVAANYSINGESTSSTNETSASVFRLRLLERDPESSMTQLRSGVNVIYVGGPNCWPPKSGSTYADTTNSLMLAFDNGVQAGSNQNHADIKAGSPRTCIGVDFGEPVYFALMRFWPRINNTNSNGARLAGSNESDWYNDGKFANLTEAVSGFEIGAGYWFELPSLDTDTAYRYLFCHNPSLNGWNDNVSELQLYGWTEAEVMSVAQDATDITATWTCGTAPSVTLAWTPVKYGTYTIKRKTGDGEWEVVASALSAATTTWTDADVVCDGPRYTYRITTINGANEAYSADCEVRPYSVGSGVGLHGEWWTNYVVTTGGEALALVTTNAMIDIANASVCGATESLLARWSGRLIAPFADDYSFEADADGGVYLWIDGSPILYNNVQSGAINLAAGEHDITVKWHHKDGAGRCRLIWGGAVARAVIPATQLLPVPPRALPEGWVNARSFDVNSGSLWGGDLKANADGSFDVAHSGRDLSWGTVGYDFMWQPVKGDFTIKTKIECLQIPDRFYGRKVGVMVRSSLDASAMMRAYGVKRTDSGGQYFYALGVHKTTGTGQYVREQDKVSGAPLGAYPATPTWVRLSRRGNVFTCQYKVEGVTDWSTHYEYEDANSEYGETTYVGLATWGEGDGTYTAVPYYLWRFSNVWLHTPRGTAVIIR